MKKTALVIGSGFSGLSAASHLAKAGYDVTVLEKNSSVGGRARKFGEKNFVFDMGPSWYWMPDVFEKYFSNFGKKVSDYYELIRLDPSYTVYFPNNEKWEIPADMQQLENLFESHEKGAALKLKKFLSEAQYKYKVGINDLVYKPSRSIFEFTTLNVLYGVFKMDVFKSMHSHIRSLFTNPFLIQLLEFPILFLGALPKNTPALYSLMNYADMSLGTWYPKGGMYKIVEAMHNLATELGVRFKFDSEVKSYTYNNNKIIAVNTSAHSYKADVIVSGADYHHSESLLPKKFKSYSEQYWDKRFLAPSSLIFYVGINKKLKNVTHHSLFFDTNFYEHAHEIYTTPKWPTSPLFYVSVTSVTDNESAPEGCENLFFLIPTAVDLKDTLAEREHYFDILIERFERLTGNSGIKEAIVYKRSYAHNDFKNDYHAYKGNAYGLANTLMQTAILKPALKSKKIKNLYYTGQLTVPGPGVPPSLISGEVVAKEIIKDFK